MTEAVRYVMFVVWMLGYEFLVLCWAKFYQSTGERQQMKKSANAGVTALFQAATWIGVGWLIWPK